MRLRLLPLLALAACSGPTQHGTSGSSSGSGWSSSGSSSASSSSSGSTGSLDAHCADTWASFGSGFFSRYCLGCHSDLTESDAVENSDTYSSEISSRAMPPGDDQPSAADRARIVAYLDCLTAAQGGEGGTNGSPP